MRIPRFTPGFTLIEVLMVIGIISILAAIVLVALNPARQFAQGRNAQRLSNVNTILNAIGQYQAEHLGALPQTLTAYVPWPESEDIYIKDDQANLCADLVPAYIASLPTDPQSPSEGRLIEKDDDGVCVDADIDTEQYPDVVDGFDSGYTVEVLADSGRVRICAPLAANETAVDEEDREPICVTR